MAAVSARPQGMPKEKASDYPVHKQLPTMELAAEYLVHSIPGPKGSIIARDYLVIEVAGYPVNHAGAAWKTEQFVVRVNGKRLLLAQTAQMVAASLKYSDWEQTPRVVGGAGAGNGGIIFGQPPNPGRFPGDPNRTGSDPVHQPPRAPQSDPGGPDRAPETPADEICLRMALQDGSFKSPTSGLLYFPFSGKLKSIHALELLYEDADGNRTTLPLI